MRPLLLTLVVILSTGCGATPPTPPDAEPIVGPPGSPDPGSVSLTTRGILMGSGRYVARGSATLTITGTTAVLDLGSDFQASSVPDPVIYVGASANPNVGTALRIGRFQSSGSQRFQFTLPPAVAAEVRFVMLWCDAFNAAVGFAPLN